MSRVVDWPLFFGGGRRPRVWLRGSGAVEKMGSGDSTHATSDPFASSAASYAIPLLPMFSSGGSLDLFHEMVSAREMMTPNMF